MNWRLIMAVFLILFSIMITFFFPYHSEQAVAQMQHQLEEILSAETISEQEKKVSEFLQQSERHLTVFSFVFEKNRVRDIKMSIDELKNASYDADGQQMRQCAEQILILLDALVDAQTLNLSNIF